MTSKHKRLLWRIPIYVILVLGVVVSLFPFWWMVVTSLKSNIGIFNYPPQLFPPYPPHFENYQKIFDDTGLGRAFLNSIVISLTNVAGVFVTCSMAAYAFAKIRFRGRNILFLGLVSTMMVPIQITLIPMFLIFRTIGWIDTFLPLTVPIIFANAYGVFLLRQFYMTLPDSLAESAKIDGASQPRIFASIMFPLCVPAMAVLGVFTFQNSWNSFLTPIIYLSDKTKFTVPLIITQFRTSQSVLWNQMMAAATVAILPMVIIYIFAQKYFVEGIAITGIRA